MRYAHAPVSYTHLDVYKRQALYREAAGAGYPDAQCALGVLHHQGKGCLLYTSRCV